VINYEEIDTYMTDGSSSFVAIMTNKYTYDQLVLSKIIRNNYKFIGVLGSKAKLKTMWDVLQKKDFIKQELDKVKAPIGLSIQSETPEEIAVRIAAQIIQIKNSF
jgi:xanthine dehydrogenase accessory factor